MRTERAWLIDASIYIFRAWFSLPDNWYTRDGQPVQAVYGYTRFLLDFIEHVGTQFYGAAAFDESLGSNYRNDIYPQYKSSRELPDEALAFQLQACRKVTEHIGIPCYGGPRYEADDYLASIANNFQQRQVAVTVVTRDKDLGQIMCGGEDRWWDFAGDTLLDSVAFEQKFGVKPQQFADYLALVGDPVDDIPGVPGIGAKTAAKLLQAFPDLAALEYALKHSMEQVAGLNIRGAAGVASRLQEHWPQVLLARQLTGLETQIAEVDEQPTARLTSANMQAVLGFLDELDIGGPLNRRCEKLMKELPST